MDQFNRNVGDLILYTFLKLPERDMESYVKLKIQDFVAKPYNTKELYHFLDSIAKMPSVRIGGLAVISDVSGFMTAAANVSSYYVPEEDEARMIDLEWCEDQVSKPSRS